MCHVISVKWHGLDLAYVPCGMSYVVFRCHVRWLRPNICGMSYALPKCHMVWPKPNICAMWHVIALLMYRVTWLKFSIGAMWHG
jgi:hypothetical protein